ncbi:MAG TPA: hypothetical protein PK263_01455 [bacterium]|nr:hypothetical protein [bacterium]
MGKSEREYEMSGRVTGANGKEYEEGKYTGPLDYQGAIGSKSVHLQVLRAAQKEGLLASFRCEEIGNGAVEVQATFKDEDALTRFKKVLEEMISEEREHEEKEIAARYRDPDTSYRNPLK